MKKVILLLIILAVGGFGWYYTQNAAANETSLRFFGNVENRTQDLAFRFLGTIAAIDKDEGARIAKGERLATLDTRSLQYTLDALRAQIDAEQARLEKLKKGYRSEDIAQAKAALAESKAVLDAAKDTYKRQKKLFEATVTTEQDFVAVTAQFDKAKASYEKAQSSYALLNNGYEPEDIRAQEAKIMALRSQAQGLEYDINESTLYAPAEGTILSRYKEPGSVVTPAERILEIALEDEYWVRSYVDEPLLGKIKRGEKMHLYIDSREEPYVGHIGFISPVAEFTPKNIETMELRPDLVYRFRIIIENPDAMLKQGMPVTIVPQTKN